MRLDRLKVDQLAELDRIAKLFMHIPVITDNDLRDNALLKLLGVVPSQDERA